MIKLASVMLAFSDGVAVAGDVCSRGPTFGSAAGSKGGNSDSSKCFGVVGVITEIEVEEVVFSVVHVVGDGVLVLLVHVLLVETVVASNSIIRSLCCG